MTKEQLQKALSLKTNIANMQDKLELILCFIAIHSNENLTKGLSKGISLISNEDKTLQIKIPTAEALQILSQLQEKALLEIEESERKFEEL